jgi:WD40 repeat protein
MNKVRTISFSPDGKVLASGSDDQSIQVWDTVNMKLLVRLTGHSGGVFDLTFSPDGKILASGSEDKTIKLWTIPFDTY